MFGKIRPYVLYIAWVQALVATLGSLFFSEVLKYPPCVLCWYQRIFMYPLALMIPLGILKKDKHLPMYMLVLAIPGSLIAIYHNLLYYNIIPEAQAPCALGVSCTTKFIEFLGFITIPFLSFLSFVVIIACVLVWKFTKKNG